MRLLCLALVLITTLARGDILRLKDTGQIVAKGHGKLVSAPFQDGKDPKNDIKWIDCDGKVTIYHDADKYYIDEGDNCGRHNDPHAIPPGVGGSRRLPLA